jgi:3D (Asp-Asp-Asp) domain-containing protein
MKRHIFLLIGLFLSPLAYAQNWVIPAPTYIPPSVNQPVSDVIHNTPNMGNYEAIPAPIYIPPPLPSSTPKPIWHARPTRPWPVMPVRKWHPKSANVPHAVWHPTPVVHPVHSVNHRPHYIRHTLQVTATAYNSVPWQTSSHPYLGAWNDRLVPGMKAIAVSWDLLNLPGIGHDTQVRISGLPGVYRVLDKMNSEWHRRIDIYMGNNIQAALNWGKRPVTITWWQRVN